MTEKPLRIVLDSNVVISGLMLPASVPAQVVSAAILSSTILISIAITEELADVFRRPKFDRYDDLAARLKYLDGFLNAVETVDVVHQVFDCRDPRDNKFLELALSGDADVIITGDDDLLSLNPWRGIPILTPSAYVARYL